jgi:hydroxymethylpyrimidine/phosphomethylpyrimidine kinase
VSKSPAVVLSIAGFDPSSGAGITADLKTIAAHRLFGISCITALTVQSTQGVAEVRPLTGELVRKTLKVLLDDFHPSAVKIGMLGNKELAQAVAEVLAKAKLPNVVLDPVLSSSSGAALLDDEGIRFLIDGLLPLVDVITPNGSEAQVLAGVPVTSLEEMRKVAHQLHGRGARNVVVTGGHLFPPTDVLSESIGSTAKVIAFEGKHVATESTHGTGCAFASALACNLALGKNLGESVGAAKDYVNQALRQAYRVGKGKGPVNHLFRLDSQND